jgi:hypothetical protein
MLKIRRKAPKSRLLSKAVLSDAVGLLSGNSVNKLLAAVLGLSAWHHGRWASIQKED